VAHQVADERIVIYDQHLTSWDGVFIENTVLAAQIVAALAADFLHQDDCGDFMPLSRPCTCRTRSARPPNCYQRFHLHAGSGRRGDAGSDLHAILAQASGHINVR